jgi:hypothetical protein
MVEFPRRALMASIAYYQRWLSPLLGSRCRFHPTCSQYMLESVREHGAWRGVLMGVARLSRCHPWSAGGIDPVPPRFSWRFWRRAEPALPCTHDAHERQHDSRE